MTKAAYFKSLLSLYLYFLALSFLAHSAPARRPPANFVLFISPSIEESKKNDFFRRLSYFVIGGTGKPTDSPSGMLPKDTLQIFNAATQKSILKQTFAMPSDADSEKKRFRATEELRTEIRKYLADKTQSVSYINVPKIASDYKQLVDSKDSRTLLVGSPLYHDDVPAHDMRDAWLSDGYFFQPLSATTFSIEGRQGAFRGNPITFCTVSDDIYGTENKNAHLEGVKRFWAIFISKCGGRLVGYQPDFDAAFKNLEKDDLEEIGPYTASSGEPMKKISSKTNLQKQSNSPSVSTEERISEALIDLKSTEYSWLTEEITSWKASDSPSPNTRLGLSWKTTPDNGRNTDLDLYVRIKGSADELSFRNDKTAQGLHFKDFSNPDAHHGFELVNLNAPYKEASLDVWVNVFSGTAKNGFSGEVRLLCGGKLKAFPFTIPATQGDQGIQSKRRAQSSTWVHIPIQ
jgi:hypothetical protein